MEFHRATNQHINVPEMETGSEMVGWEVREEYLVTAPVAGRSHEVARAGHLTCGKRGRGTVEIPATADALFGPTLPNLQG